MPFKPESITREHILQAIKDLDNSQRKLSKSTRFDVVFEGRRYPPKELMRRAHELATGEYLWEKSGGEQTNKYLKDLNFEIQGKSNDQSPFPDIIRRYKELLRTEGLADEIYKWELIEQFKGRPNLDASDLLAEIKEIKYMNLIYGPGIGVIYTLAREQTEPYRRCLKDLFNDVVELSQRIKNFSTTALRVYREIDQQPNHLPHHDERTAATLLTYYNPSRYTFYKDSFYQILCRVTGEPPAEPGNKYVHYLRIVEDFIDGYVREDTELEQLIVKLKSPGSFQDQEFLILAQDILYRILEIKGRTFISLMDEVSQTLQDMEEQPQLVIYPETTGKKNQREWMWGGDGQGLIGTTLAHYEFEVLPKERDKIYICIHFEDDVHQKIFRERIGKDLPDKLQWFHWFDADSIKLKEPVNFYGEHTVSQLIEKMTYVDQAIGNEVRKIIKELRLNELTQKIKMSQPLNQILYGPPGTGKTYHTINKALSILDGNLDGLNRIELKSRYDEYVKAGRIVFTTFHQSLGYEDFVEGIKPLEPQNEASTLQYETKPGIFKLICNAAKLPDKVKIQNEETFNKVRFHKMSLGGLQNPHIHDWCIKNNCVGLGWGGDKKFAGYDKITQWKEYRDKFQKEFPDLVIESRYNITAMFNFQKMKIGDIVVISKGNNIIDAIGRITSDYYWSDENDFEYYQFKKVEWLATNLNQTPETFFRKKVSQQSIYEFYDEDIKRDAFKDLFKPDGQEVKPFVLIIDEINRGNVSRVFGELITLLEPDKRIGNPEALKVTLPYSRDEFGVPMNLYLIGTMNTADRSVEALDSALRRRFNFQEMQPMPELLAPQRMFWQMLWDHEGAGWEDETYVAHEQGLMELFEIKEYLKQNLEKIWEGWKYIRNETQISDLKPEYFTGINLESLLNTLNERLEILRDRDHQIGHAYLITVRSIDDLISRFRDNIIPLLQEYFFGDYRKLRLILGDGFINSKTVKASFAVNDEDEPDSKELFKINDSAFDSKENFLAAYRLMGVK